MTDKILDLQSKIASLQRKNAELFMLADTVQSFATAKTADQIVDKLLEYCAELTGAQKIYFLSNEAKSKKLEAGICVPIDLETYYNVLQQTKDQGITVTFDPSKVQDSLSEISNCTSILLSGDPKRYIVMVNLPLPENSKEYVEVISKIADPFVLALKEKAYYELLLKSEKALLESEVKFRTVANFTYDWVYWITPEGNLVYVSPSCKKVTGYGPDEFIKNPNLIANIVHPDDKLLFDSHFDLTSSEEQHDIDFRIITRNGETCWLSHVCQNVFGSDGQWLGRRVSNRDITERKKLQSKLEDYAKNLESLVEERTKQLKDSERFVAIGQTAGMVGHDIRNPLHSIIGEVYLIKKEVDDLPESEAKKSLKESSESIENNVAYINKIVTDLQNFAKAPLTCIEEVDLRKLVDDVLSTLTIPEQVQVVYTIEQGLPKLRTDVASMKRILTNLCLNAVQAMPEGGKLSIGAVCKTGQFFVSVKDTGVGMPKEVKEKIFTPLFTTKPKGQGFGLAVVKKLTEGLNGKVTVESEVGKGTRFTLEFQFLMT